MPPALIEASAAPLMPDRPPPVRLTTPAAAPVMPGRPAWPVARAVLSGLLAVEERPIMVSMACDWPETEDDVTAAAMDAGIITFTSSGGAGM